MPASSAVTVPLELQKQFPELIALLLGSESMNDEERQYWINILPVMTPDQRGNLQKILQNEKEQLAAIDAKYAKEIAATGRGKPLEEIENARRFRRQKQRAIEKKVETEEARKEREILEAIEKGK